MKFTINQKQLLAALNICSKAIGTNTIVPATSYYRLTNDSVSACNMEISITAPITTKGDVFDIMLPSDKLKPLITSLSDMELTFEWDILEMLVTITGNGKYEMQGEIGTDFPIIKVKDGYSFEVDIADLAEAFYRTSYSWKNDNTDSVLNGLAMELTKEGIDFISFNGLSSIAKFTIPEKCKKDSRHILPKTFVNCIDGTGNCTVDVSDKSISVTHQGVVIKSLLMDGTFLDWQKIAIQPQLTTTCNKAKLIDVLKRVMLFSNSLYAQVLIEINNGKLTISAQELTLKNKAVETIDCSPSGEFNIAVNGRTLLEALLHISVETVGLYIKDEKSLMWIKDINEIDCFAMIAPQQS